MTHPSATRLVVVPMKDPAHAKTRLSDILDPAHRAGLAISLFKRTLSRLSSAKADSRHGFDVATVTASPAIAAIARSMNVAVIKEGQPRDLNAAVQLAAEVAAKQGYHDLVVLPGDLAAPTQPDLLHLLDRDTCTGHVVLCASTDGGTNALLLPLPARIRFRYGPASFQAHRNEAQKAGLGTTELGLESLRHDVDRRENLLRFPALYADLLSAEVHP